MTVLFVVFYVLIAITMLFLGRNRFIDKLFTLLAFLSLLLFSSIVSYAIWRILEDQTVFMTSIHAIFLEPLFLVSGAYLLFFGLYRLMQEVLSF